MFGGEITFDRVPLALVRQRHADGLARSMLLGIFRGRAGLLGIIPAVVVCR
jgi:hypothetical protein